MREKGGVLIVDEIYQRLMFHSSPPSVVGLGEDIVSVNSFSKTFSMTGWRLGWVVAPTDMMDSLERLSQNLFISPSAIAQQAALAAFEPESLATAQGYRERFREQGDYLLGELTRLGFSFPAMPDGAFYAWADVSPTFDKLGVSSSWDWVFKILQDTHIAVAPGRDFGADERMVRFSTAGSMGQLEEALRRLQQRLA